MSAPAPAQTLLIQLKDHLDAELTVHAALLGYAERKQREIVSGDINAFARLLGEEQTVMSKVDALRQIRERLLLGVAAVLGIPFKELTLSTIIARLADPLKSDLVRRQTDLQRILQRLRQVNERNLLLIRQSLAFAREVLHAVLGERSPAPGIYDRRGSSGGGVPMSSSGRLLDLAG
jgi:flagellar biosynthesis/type III secretory pathway chaperone